MNDIRRAIRKHYSAEEMIRVVLHGLRGESSIAEQCSIKHVVLRDMPKTFALPQLPTASPSPRHPFCQSNGQH